jgi:hypothetical protein
MAVGEMMVLDFGWPGPGQEVAHGAIDRQSPHQPCAWLAIGNDKEISLVRQLHLWIIYPMGDQPERYGDVSLPRHSIHSTANG